MGLEDILQKRREAAKAGGEQAQQQAEAEKQQAQQLAQQKVEGGAKEVYEGREKQVDLNTEKQEAGERSKVFVEKKKGDLTKIKALRTELGLAEMDTDDAEELLQGMGLSDEEKREVLADLTSTEAGEKEAASMEEQKLGEINAINANTEKIVGGKNNFVMEKIYEDALKKDEEFNEQKEGQEETKMQSLEEEDQKLSPEEKAKLEEQLLDQEKSLIKTAETVDEPDFNNLAKKIERLQVRIFRLGGPKATETLNRGHERALNEDHSINEKKQRLEKRKNWDNEDALKMDEEFDKYKAMSPEERSAAEKELTTQIEEIEKELNQKSEDYERAWSRNGKLDSIYGEIRGKYWQGVPEGSASYNHELGIAKNKALDKFDEEHGVEMRDIKNLLNELEKQIEGLKLKRNDLSVKVEALKMAVSQEKTKLGM